MRINLRNNEHAIALTLDCISHDFFRAAVAIHLGGINQCHAEFDSEPQSGDFVLVRSLALAHAPRALTQYGYAFAIREGNCLHFVFMLMLLIRNRFAVEKRRSPAFATLRRGRQTAATDLAFLREQDDWENHGEYDACSSSPARWRTVGNR
jgi:hypothetical protein